MGPPPGPLLKSFHPAHPPSSHHLQNIPGLPAAGQEHYAQSGPQYTTQDLETRTPSQDWEGPTPLCVHCLVATHTHTHIHIYIYMYYMGGAHALVVWALPARPSRGDWAYETEGWLGE